MGKKQQPEALRLAEMLTADEWPGSVTLVSYARSALPNFDAFTPTVKSLSRSLHSALTRRTWLRQQRRGLGMGLQRTSRRCGGTLKRRRRMVKPSW